MVIILAMTNQEKFKVLADQIKISNQLETDILNEGELTRIDVSIRIEHGTNLHYHVSLHEDYLLFTHAIEEEFKEIATVTSISQLKIQLTKTNMH